MADEVIAECENGHDLTEKDVATGECPTCGVDLFPGKQPVPSEAPLSER